MCLIHVLGSQEYFQEMEPTALCPLDLITNSIVDMEVCIWPHILNEFSRSTCNLKSLILQCVLLDNFSIQKLYIVSMNINRKVFSFVVFFVTLEVQIFHHYWIQPAKPVFKLVNQTQVWICFSFDKLKLCSSYNGK